jgi:acyl-CoA dehydrogenase
MQGLILKWHALLVLKTAFLIDTVGAMGALSEVSQIKVVAPNLACRILDQAIQMHGGKGMSNDTPLLLCLLRQNFAIGRWTG